MKPHEKVYTRLGVSKITEGVGVFAICDIPKGTDLFEMNKLSELVKAPQEEVESLPEGIKKMYHDFCPLYEGVYECLPSFALLTPSWYLNHSTNNNADIDDEYNFIANRDIKEGEEITANYETYSEIPPGEVV